MSKAGIEIPKKVYEGLEAYIRSLIQSGEWFVGRLEGARQDHYGQNNIVGGKAMLAALKNGNLDELYNAWKKWEGFQTNYEDFGSDDDANMMLDADLKHSQRILSQTKQPMINHYSIYTPGAFELLRQGNRT